MVRHYQTETDFFASLRTICRLALSNKANTKCVPTSQQSDCEICPNVSLQEQQAIVAEDDTSIYMDRCLRVDLFANVS